MRFFSYVSRFLITFTICCYLVAKSRPTLCDPMDCSMSGLPVSHHLPEMAQVHVHCIGDAIQSSHPLMPSFPSALNLSQHQGLFQWVSCLHQMTISFSSASAPSKEYSEFKCLKIDWFYLLSVHGIFSNLLQHHSLKASILWHSAFFMVQLSKPYMTTGKTMALTIRTFVSREMSLLFNTLSRFDITFLPRSNHLISLSHSSQWLWSPRRGNLSLLPPFSLLFPMKQWGQMPWS